MDAELLKYIDIWDKNSHKFISDKKPSNSHLFEPPAEKSNVEEDSLRNKIIHYMGNEIERNQVKDEVLNEEELKKAEIKKAAKKSASTSNPVHAPTLNTDSNSIIPVDYDSVLERLHNMKIDFHNMKDKMNTEDGKNNKDKAEGIKKQLESLKKEIDELSDQLSPNVFFDGNKK